MTNEQNLMADSAQAPRALLIDGDALLRRSWEKSLRAEGFAVTGTGEADAALILTGSFKPDIVMLDLRMRTAGSQRAGLFSEIRAMTDAYLVGVTDHSDELERVRLLRAGADDLLTKPISSIELAAKLRALLRRPRRITEGLILGPPPTIMHYGTMQIDLGRRQVVVEGAVVPLTRIEFDLLSHLCQRPRDVSTRAELLRNIWGEHWVGDDHVVDVHLSNLRRKLNQHAPSEQFILTVRGVGFRLSDELLRGPAETPNTGHEPSATDETEHSEPGYDSPATGTGSH